jgi:hypothetical protein
VSSAALTADDTNSIPDAYLRDVQTGTLTRVSEVSRGATDVEEVATGRSGLQNQGGGYYQFNWATQKSYAKTCRTVRLDLGDSLLHTAEFRFK